MSAGRRVLCRLIAATAWLGVGRVGMQAAVAAEKPDASASVSNSLPSTAASLAPRVALRDIIRRRELNPLRAARLLAAASVAIDESERLRLPDPALSLALVLAWLDPRESQSVWISSRWGALDAQRFRAARDAVLPVLVRSLDDGSDVRRRPLTKPAWRPGLWARTPPLFAEQPAEPQAPGWRPWCPGTESLTVSPPPTWGSSQASAELREVLDTTRRLTPAQKDIAERWHLDAGSITPPGLWNLLVEQYLVSTIDVPRRASRAMALMNMAMHDALVAAWRIKLTHWTERPVSAIQRELDPHFMPHLHTPPFPGYVSGHAAASGAAAAVLSHFFPAERARWQALAAEAAVSRLYGGIHVRSDNEAGLQLGAQVAAACLARFEATGGAVEQPLVSAVEGTWADFFVLPRIAEPR